MAEKILSFVQVQHQNDTIIGIVQNVACKFESMNSIVTDTFDAKQSVLLLCKSIDNNALKYP